MTEVVYYVDGVNHTEETESEIHKMMQARSGYIGGYGTELAVIQNTPAAMNVVVGIGKAWFNGILYKNTAAKTVTVEAADATNPRIDTAIIRLTWATDTCEAVILKGTAAASPAAPALTQTSAVWEFPLMDITIPAETTAITTAMLTNDRSVDLYAASISFIIDGGGKVIATGNKGYLDIPFNCTIKSWDILPAETGSIVCDLLVGTYATHPTYTSIVASDKPTCTAAAKATGSALTGWTTAITAGQKLKCNVDSCTTVTLATLILHVSLATE